MTAPTEKQVREWVDAAGNRASVNGMVADGIAYWLGELVDEPRGFVTRWSCDDDKCPARPDYDKRLSELYEEYLAKLEAECEAIVLAGLTNLVTTFAAEYPDAPRRKVEVAA